MISLKLKFLLFVVLAIFIIISKDKFSILDKVSIYIDNMITPLYYFCNQVNQSLKQISQIIIIKKQLILENKKLQHKLFLQTSNLLILKKLQEDNIQLRKLLDVPIANNEKKIFALPLMVNTNPLVNQILIDKGNKDNVYVGQPVIDDQGLIGQVILVNKSSSKVLLICDSLHEVPVKTLRDNTHAIICGSNSIEHLILKNIPDNSNIQVGDILITSGIDGRFPSGYPVAIISSIKLNTKNKYTKIQATPIANLKSIKYLLLLYNNISSNIIISFDIINNISNKTLNKVNILN